MIQKIRQRLTKLYLHPVRVYCLHHVCAQANPIVTCPGDWISEDEFIISVQKLKDNGFRFLSLTEAYTHIKQDRIRIKNYAVLTFDDGYRSSLQIYHWLEDHHIPYTLFLNAKYMDGTSASPHIIKHARSINPNVSLETIIADLYLSKEDLMTLSPQFSQFGSHSYEHLDATEMQANEFAGQIHDNLSVLRQFPQFIPFHAYTWGRHTSATNRMLNEFELIPVYMDGNTNYGPSHVIHRELFEHLH